MPSNMHAGEHGARSRVSPEPGGAGGGRASPLATVRVAVRLGLRVREPSRE